LVPSTRNGLAFLRRIICATSMHRYWLVRMQWFVAFVAVDALDSFVSLGAFVIALTTDIPLS
jgi:hypothetical protein